jgi:hypothetical protein
MGRAIFVFAFVTIGEAALSIGLDDIQKAFGFYAFAAACIGTVIASLLIAQKIDAADARKLRQASPPEPPDPLSIAAPPLRLPAPPRCPEEP